MPTNFDFVWDQGTSNNGLIAAALDLLTTELNALASGAVAVSSVGGAAGVFSNANTGAAIFAIVQMKLGGALGTALAAGSYLSGWFLESLDGTTFELGTAAPQRPADFIVPFAARTYASGEILLAAGRIARIPAAKFKLLVQNNLGVALPATGNKITIGAVASHLN